MLTFDGIDAMLQRLTALDRQALPAARDAVDAETELVLFRSQPLVPVLTGALLSSGHPIPAQAAGGVVTGEIRYGEGLDYGIRVHEDSFMRHPRGGQAHFLSEPWFAATSTMLADLAEVIARSLGGSTYG